MSVTVPNQAEPRRTLNRLLAQCATQANLTAELSDRLYEARTPDRVGAVRSLSQVSDAARNTVKVLQDGWKQARELPQGADRELHQQCTTVILGCYDYVLESMRLAWTLASQAEELGAEKLLEELSELIATVEQLRETVRATARTAKPWQLGRFPSLTVNWAGYEAVASTALAVGAVAGILCSWSGTAPLWLGGLLGYLGVCSLAALSASSRAREAL